MMKCTNFFKEEDGFSLVEMAIVLLIIGLIIGGVMKGQELLESARLKAVVTQANQYRLATNTFIDRYEALPGDFHRASELINPQLQNGNNNGVIEGLGLASGQAPFAHEAVSFWQHLAAANLIPSPGQCQNEGQAHFNKGAPGSKLGGGFTIRSQPFPEMAGHWLVLGHENGSEGNNALLTPQQALSIANKIDSDDPNSGYVRVKDGANAPAQSCVKSTGEFNIQNKNPVCVLYMQM